MVFAQFSLGIGSIKEAAIGMVSPIFLYCAREENTPFIRDGRSLVSLSCKSLLTSMDTPVNVVNNN